MSGFVLTSPQGVVIVAESSTQQVGSVAGFPSGDISAGSQTATSDLYTDADNIFPGAIENLNKELYPALVASDDNFKIHLIYNTLLPLRFTDTDTFYAPVLQRDDKQASLVVDTDSFYAPTVVPGPRTLTVTARYNDSDTFFQQFVTLVGTSGGPQQKLRPPPKVQDQDIFYSPRMSSMTGLVVDFETIWAPTIRTTSAGSTVLVVDTDTIFAVSVAAIAYLRPLTLASDDDILPWTLTRALGAELLLDDDEIMAADVGWQVIAEFTDDTTEDAIFSVDAYAFYPLYPEVWFDEETIDTYPFFVQAVEGGIPVPPREGTLTGSIKRKPVLTGSIARRRLVA